MTDNKELLASRHIMQARWIQQPLHLPKLRCFKSVSNPSSVGRVVFNTLLPAKLL